MQGSGRFGHLVPGVLNVLGVHGARVGEGHVRGLLGDGIYEAVPPLELLQLGGLPVHVVPLRQGKHALLNPEQQRQSKSTPAANSQTICFVSFGFGNHVPEGLVNLKNHILDLCKVVLGYLADRDVVVERANEVEDAQEGRALEHVPAPVPVKELCMAEARVKGCACMLDTCLQEGDKTCK